MGWRIKYSRFGDRVWRQTSSFQLWRSLVAMSVVIGAAQLSLAYTDERPNAPDGEVIGRKITFHIEVDGEPQKEEFYRIEVARDDEFEFIVAEFDGRKTRAGWRLGTYYGAIPDEYQIENYAGLRYKTNLKLDDGEYFWRVSKALGGSDWMSIDGVLSFFVDSVAPGTVENLEFNKQSDGSIEISWSEPYEDLAGEAEEVAGYRVYRYSRRLKRYPTLTKYLVAEVEDTRHVLSAADIEAEQADELVFYRVQAVDMVGNEEGRRSPRVMGSFADAFNPPDLDKLANPEEIRRRIQEELGGGVD